MARCILLTLVLAACSVQVVDNAPSSPDQAPNERLEVPHIERSALERPLRDTQDGPTLRIEADPELRTRYFGGQEGEPVTQPPEQDADGADPETPATDGFDSSEGDSDSDGGIGTGVPPAASDTSDTGDTQD